jgi:uncharacterized protein (DUF1697 family)
LLLFFKKEGLSVLTPKIARIPHIGLLRAVNVGRANRIAMSDVRAIVEALGYTGVRTLLNSGNVIFEAPRGAAPKAAAAVEAALTRHAINTRVVVVTAAALRDILALHPFPDLVTDPARLLVALFAGGAAPPRVAPLAERDWDPDQLALVEGAAFLWCATGIHDGVLQKAFSRAAGDTATARNWTTMTQLVALAAQTGG